MSTRDTTTATTAYTIRCYRCKAHVKLTRLYILGDKTIRLCSPCYKEALKGPRPTRTKIVVTDGIQLEFGGEYTIPARTGRKQKQHA